MAWFLRFNDLSPPSGPKNLYTGREDLQFLSLASPIYAIEPLNVEFSKKRHEALVPVIRLTTPKMPT